MAAALENTNSQKHIVFLLNVSENREYSFHHSLQKIFIFRKSVLCWFTDLYLKRYPEGSLCTFCRKLTKLQLRKQAVLTVFRNAGSL